MSTSGMYIAAEGAQAQSKRMEALANNMANVDTVGFKADMVVAQARYTESILQGLDYAGSGSLSDIGGGVKTVESVTNFGSGPLKPTNIPTDMAIVGEGFFEVEKDGERFLTRAGNFGINPQGQLITQSGHNVLSAGGAPITIDPTLPWTVTAQGEIEQGGVPTPLSIQKPASLGDLEKKGLTLFKSLSAPVPMAPNEREVRGGHLELSGVKPTDAMMELITTGRVYEANVQMIKNHDQMLGNLISRVLGS